MSFQGIFTPALNRVSILSSMLLELSPSAISQTVRRPKVGRAVIPKGYQAFAVAIGNGVSAELSDFVSTESAEFQRCQTEDFQRSSQQIEAHRNAAREFFKTRFGVDVEQTQEDFSFDSFVVQPKTNYRVYAIGGEKVPAEGFPLSDCGYRLTVINPEGVVLGGEFAGVKIPVGSICVYGDYAIRKKLPNNKLKTIYIVSFQSATPLIPLADGTANFKCELNSSEWGRGLGEGFLAFGERDPKTGSLKANQRNVWTFSKSPLNGL